MKKLISLLLAITILTTYASYVSAKTPAIFLYVSQDGDDTACGTLEHPLKTISAALNLAKAETMPVVINIRQGVYTLTEPVNLSSGHTDIVIRSYMDEDVTFTGTTRIPMNAFGKCTDEAFLDALSDPSARDKIMSANLFDLGITNLGVIEHQGFITTESGVGYTPTFSFNEKPFTLAQYPNEGYLTTETIISATGERYKSNYQAIEYTLSDKRYKNWAGKDIWANGYFTYDWCNAVAPAQITENDTITGYTLRSYAAQPGRRVRFFNVPEELDTPGEYYLNRETGVLYMIPTEDIKPYHSFTYTNYNQRLFYLYKSKNITFQGIKFTGTRNYGIYATNCDGIVIDDCEFADIGNIAVYIYSCYRSGVKNSYLHDLGSWGIKTQNCGNRRTLVPSECFITNCRVERFGTYKRCGAMGIQIYYDMGTVVSHCEISDGPYIGLRFEGNDVVVEYTKFSNLCYETSDTGMIYTGRRYDTPGGVIRYNYFADTNAIPGTTGMKTQAVYLDDMVSSISVYGNVFHKIPAVALMGGGRYNTFENNIMLECNEPLWFDARGTWGGSWTDMNNTMISNLKSMPYKTGVWAEKYPHLVNILDDEPHIPKHNILRNNILYKTPEFRLDYPVSETGTVENNVTIVGTNSFADYKNQNFTQLANSEIYKKCPGFKEIPFTSIGTYQYQVRDEYEPTLYRRHTAYESIEASEDGDGIKLTNHDVKPFNLGIFSPVYETADGIKIMTDIALSFITLNENAELKTKDSDIIISMDNIEPIR